MRVVLHISKALEQRRQCRLHHFSLQLRGRPGATVRACTEPPEVEWPILPVSVALVICSFIAQRTRCGPAVWLQRAGVRSNDKV